MSQGEVCIMMFCACPENVSLTHSTKFITVTFLRYSFRVPPGNKNNQVYQCLINFRETSQGRPNCVLK